MQGRDPVEMTLTAVEMAALGDRFGVSVWAPPADAGTAGPGTAGPEPAGPGPAGRAGRDEAAVEAALARLAERGVIGPEVGSPIEVAPKTALTVLAAPEILIRMERRDSTTSGAASIALAGGHAAEHRMVEGGRHRISLFARDEALDRVIGFLRLVDRPVTSCPGFVVTPAELVQVVGLVGRGDADKAARVLARPDRHAASTGAFVRALASQAMAAHVTVLAYRDDRRMESTATSWLDAGELGLWRVPAAGTTPLRPVHPNERLLGPAMEVRPVTMAALIGEITEGFPELGTTGPVPNR